MNRWKRRSILPTGLACLCLLPSCASQPKSEPAPTPATPGEPTPPPPPPMQLPPRPPPPGGTGSATHRAEAPTPAPSTAPDPATATTTPTAPRLVQLFPSVRAAAGARMVEFDATAAAAPHDPATPHVYLELLACTPDTREHESLVVTRALPSHIHAAMLLAGFTPGAPASWSFENNRLVPTPPAGDPVRIEFVWIDAAGHERTAQPGDWIANVKDGRSFPTDGPGWVFAGSAIVRRQSVERYDADMSGTVIGLATFGGELVAWSNVFSHEAEINAPEWIVNAEAFPPFGTPITVRISSPGSQP